MATITNPNIIFEVTSPKNDLPARQEKWIVYQAMPSVSDYLLVAGGEIRIEHYHRLERSWLYSNVAEPDTIIELPSAGARLRIADIYERVDFTA